MAKKSLASYESIVEVVASLDPLAYQCKRGCTEQTDHKTPEKMTCHGKQTPGLHRGSDELPRLGLASPRLSL